MLKRLGNILLWGLLLGYLIIVFTFVARKEEDLSCREIGVIVEDSSLNRFVDDKDVLQLITRSKQKVIGISMDSINKEELENLISKIPAVKKAEVYSTLTGNLQVVVEQRKPILRILNGNSGYYLDEGGAIMPLSRRYTSRILVASGKISRELATGELYQFAKFIREDEFWNAQIDQIYVTSSGEYILIPRVGAQKILFGSFDNYKYKFKKLYALYRDGFSKVGWNKYKTINLKFENQVVCTKR